MEIVHLCYTLLPIVWMMICYSTTDGYNLSWKIEHKIVQYGDDLSLFCQVDNCCLEEAGWGKWTHKNELVTIFIDVRDIDAAESSKYAGETNMSGFSLVIRNLSREDLNIAYSCTYGFHVSQKKILYGIDAFRFDITTTTMTTNTTTKPEIEHNKDNKQVKFGLIIAVSLLAAGGVLAVLWLLNDYLKKRKSSKGYNSTSGNRYRTSETASVRVNDDEEFEHRKLANYNPYSDQEEERRRRHHNKQMSDNGQDVEKNVMIP